MDSAEMEKDAVVVCINTNRYMIKQLAADVLAIKQNAVAGRVEQREGEDRGEMIANLTLAYRHLEDASMRLGKAIQARDGGTSVYDKATTVGA